MQRCLQFFYTTGSEDTFQAKGWGKKEHFIKICTFFLLFSWEMLGGSEPLTWCSTCGNHRRRGNRQTDWARAASLCSSVRYLQSSALFSSLFFSSYTSQSVRFVCFLARLLSVISSLTSLVYLIMFSPLSLPIHHVSSCVSSLSNRQTSLFFEANRAEALFYPGFVCFQVQVSSCLRHAGSSYRRTFPTYKQ